MENKPEKEIENERMNVSLASPALNEFDERAYLPMLDDLDIDVELKRQCLGVLWNMMRMCVEMNIAAENWGQIAQGLICAACAESTGIDSE